MYRKIFWFLIKLAVTAGLILLLLSAVNVQDVLNTALSITVLSLVFASLCYVAATLISTMRWALLLSAQGIHLRFISLVAYNVSYSFYSMVLPGGKVSAEAIRIYQILKDSGHPEIREKIFLPTLLDRLLMIVTSATIAAVYFLFHARDVHEALPLWYPYVAVGVVLLIVASIFFPFERLSMFAFKGTPAIQFSILTSIKNALQVYRGHYFVIVLAVLYSFFVNVCLALAFYSIALSLGVSINPILVFEILSVGMLATVIPITIGGIGAREGVVALLLSVGSGVAIETSVTISLVTLATSLVIVVCGAGVEFYRHFIRHESA